MFDKNFYPTPDDVIDKMLEPYYRKTTRYDYEFNELQISGYILEPSAGKGNIIDYIREKNYYRKVDIHCLENNQDLLKILQTKECKIVGNDFLEWTTNYSYDLIIMNPPFNKGADHLLKAWEILINGDIVCLLNSETLRNQYSDKRKLLANLIEQHGSIEYLGPVFDTAERKTGVDVTLVRLHKETPTHFNFDTSGFKKENLEFPDDIQSNELATRDVLKSYEDRYKSSIIACQDFINAYRKLKYLVEPLYDGYVSEDDLSNYSRTSINNFIEDLTKRAWQKVLDETQFTRYLTSKVSQEFTEKFARQKDLSFTKENMIEMLNVLWYNRADIVEQCIVEAFDRMTDHHKDNRFGLEGWSTNDAWHVNRKVIFPYGISFGSWSDKPEDYRQYGKKFSLSSNAYLNDIDRGLCYLTGESYETCWTITEALKNKFEIIGNLKPHDKFDNTAESRYFDIKFFKKGTLHLTFKDEFVWNEFNKRAAAAKGFPLPTRPTDFKKKYEGTEVF